MITTITQATVERCSNAIRNVRTVAANVKKQKRIQAVQRAEFLVSDIDLFRKYCQVNAGLPIARDLYTAFKHTTGTVRMFQLATQSLKDLQECLTVAGRKSYKEEIRQVELLLLDVIAYLEKITMKGVTHA